jgi:hypothetical protein
VGFAAALLITACGSGTASPGVTGASTAGTGAAGPTAVAASNPPVGPDPGRKVMVLIEENKAYEDIVGSADAPYLTELSKRYGSASLYDAGYPAKCPSLAAYIILTSGSDHGICDDNPPSSHPLAGNNLFQQVADSGRQWRTYAQSMPANCTLDMTGYYLVKHNPAAYYTEERARCGRWDVPLGTTTAGALKTDVDAGLPALSFVIPDACNDMHGGHGCNDVGLIRRGDDYLHQWLPIVMAGPDYRAGRLTVIVTWDESSSTSTNHIPTLVISPTTNAIQDPTPQTHCTTLRTMEDLLHLSPLGCAAGVAPATTRFHLQTSP